MKPGDFLLSVQDFFAVFLPGSLAAWLAVQYISPADLQEALKFGFAGQAQPDEFVLGAAFFVASYVLGHFAFMAGAQLDPSYDRWRERAKPKVRDKAFLAAREVQKAVNGNLVDGDLTTLKWANAYIQVKAAGARAEIDRLEADQKFFRSLVVVSIAFAAHFLLDQGEPLPGVIAIVFAVLSYYRYRSRRWTMTELIFATAAIVHATNASGSQATGDSAA